MHLTASIALAVTTFLGGSLDTDTIKIQPFDSAQTVEEYVNDYFADVPVMIAIAQCESQFRQSDKNGKLLKNAHSSAIGVFQIMYSLHADNAQKNLGIDITTIEGNSAYARYLYDKSGTKPWNASKACWSKSAEHVATAN